MEPGRRDLRHTLRWLNIGGMVLLGLVAHPDGDAAPPLRDVPGLLHEISAPCVHARTLRDPTWIGRITALPSNPPWLAHELNLVYLPFWLACSLTGNSAHRIRI